MRGGPGGSRKTQAQTLEEFLPRLQLWMAAGKLRTVMPVSLSYRERRPSQCAPTQTPPLGRRSDLQMLDTKAVPTR